MMVSDIFLVASESKDKHCLDPIADDLKNRFTSVYNLDFSQDLDGEIRNILTIFATSKFPAVIISSAKILDSLTLIRPRNTFISIGIEHGIAPFKNYTYGKHLLSSDFYLAPTKGWADRLARLYPEARPKIRVGGYPKIEAIRERTTLPDSKNYPESKRILVILSWGVSDDAFELLPDHGFIDYVLHPADYKLGQRISLSRAKIHVSHPDVTYDLIASASLVIGDFSSLTLECIHLGKHVIFMIDRSIYKGACDLNATFFDNQSHSFGIIPESNCRIAMDGAISAAELAELVTIFGDDIHGIKGATTRATFDEAYLPPVSRDNRHLCVDEISKVFGTAEEWPDPEEYSVDASVNVVESMCFVSAAYQSIFGRRVDVGGLRNYSRRIFESEDNNLFKAIAVWHELSRSAEAKARNWNNARELPRIYFPSSDPLESANTSATEERLLDALDWITRAIEHRPELGEYIHFKASLLERMGLYEKALRAAREAQAHGADPDAISSDIDRITTRLNHHAEALGAQLLPNHYRQRRDAAADNAERIHYGVKIAAGSSGHVDDLVQLAHHCADEELLEDALHWIGKAIEVEPEQGAYLRFKVSILERMDRFEEALVVAHEAAARGAELQSIAADIERINSRIIAELEASARSSDTAVSLAAYSRLLAMKKLPLRDFTKFAGKIIKSYATAS